MTMRSMSLLALTVWASLALTRQAAVRVERIVDGDTVVLSQIGTARLIGVDTPETVDPRRPIQAFGKEASAFLTTIAGGQSVRVDYDQTRTDKYGRTLVYLYLSDGTFVNREIVRQGFGHAYLEFPFKHMEDFRAAEREARAAGRGLWAGAPLVTTDLRAVFVMPTGDRYHATGCRFLGAGQQAIRLDETPGHYTACLVCKPPALK